MIIADHPELLTPEWLREALDLPVTDVAIQPVGTGQMCDSVRLHLTYEPGAAAAGPATIVAKLPAGDETSRATAVNLRNYEIEVRFYQHLASQLPIRTPRALYVDIDVPTASFVLLLEDLAPARQGDQLAGCTVEQATVAIDELPKLHAPRWGDPTLTDYEWLHRDPERSRMFMLQMLPMFWAGFRDRYADRLSDDVYEAGDSLFTHLERYLDRGDTSHWTVVHGDYRLDNLLFGEPESDVPIGVVDWQTVAHGAAMNDVAYFIGAGLLPEARREHEDALVRRYHDQLVAAGVKEYDFERCWTEHRRGTWAGLIMAIAASMLVERTARGDDMFMAMANRHARHALDLDAPALLTGGG